MRWKGPFFMFVFICAAFTLLFQFPWTFSSYETSLTESIDQQHKPPPPSASSILSSAVELDSEIATVETDLDPTDEGIPWPARPFRTAGTQILNANGEEVRFVGINWPGHGLPMIPEGLQYQPIEKIVAKIKDIGMNVVRLTYATELVDDIYAEGGDVDLKSSFVRALGEANGTALYERVIKMNPQFGGQDVTRLGVFDAIAAELAKNNIYVHLDNHISKAGWCCSLNDGNGWFEDTYFNTANWIRGLKHMTNHATKHWSSFISTSLRNEPRDTPSNPTIHATYNWSTWYDNMIPAIHIVHTTTPTALIFISGLNWDRTLEPIISGTNLSDGRRFNLSSLPPKIVWELHNYNNSIKTCTALQAQLDAAGYSILTHPNSTASKRANIAPIVLSEFGFPQDTHGETTVYAQCLKEHLLGLRAGWMYWVLAGSYYEREGNLDYDEGWGVLNHDWSGWRDVGLVNGYFRELVEGVLGGI